MFGNSTWLHAPPFRPALSCHPHPSALCCSRLPMAATVRVAIVGDVHDEWNLEEDTKALQLLKPDLVLFTGDFGNENVDIVESISNLDFPKAVILGNHDAWNTMKFSDSCREKDAVQLQLEILGDGHVGYRRMDFSDLKLSVVGGRPFSCGGEQLFRKKLLIARYGVRDMNGSAKKIYEVASRTPSDHSVIFLAHNGPTGLGSNVDDICGRDWVVEAGDYGDPDLAHAIAQLKETTKLPIKLVVFGHMHKALAHGNGFRKMIVMGDDDTVYLNGAVVPRVKPIGKEQLESGNTSAVISDIKGMLRAFTVADIVGGGLEKVTETWVSVIEDEVTIGYEIELFNKQIRG